MKDILTLGQIKIPITEYASQGNAILGIRDSGKSYTATFIAERLLDAGVPFVAFDPIGIWKYLRVAGKKAGYPVVVAGGRNGDLPLTPQSAPEIVRASMKQNIPLVLDLYDMRLSKNDWKQIVESSVRLLLYENGDYGLRHIFIEEAAEFVPQRVGPDQGRVYAEIEKLARMGGNALLGYTLINQRAEEVNKAVLELCDCLFLHRQKGRNSLTALGKWLDIGSGIVDTRPIIASLPTLPQGECYIWPAGTDSPVHANIPQKNTFHPDRRATQAAASQSQNYKALDVSAFVSQMSSAIEDHLAQVKENDPAELKNEIARLRRELSLKPQAQPETVRVEVPVFKHDEMTKLEEAIKSYTTVSSLMASAIMDVTKALVTAKQVEDIRHQRFSSPPHRTVERIPAREAFSSPDGLSAPQQRILDAIAWMASVHLLSPKRTVIAFLAGQSPKSSGFKNNLSALRSMGLMRYVGNDALEFTETGRAASNILPAPVTAEELQRIILSRLPLPQAKILSSLIEAYPHSIDRAKVAEASAQSPNSSGFKNNLSALRSLGVLEYDGPQSVKALPVLFLE